MGTEPSTNGYESLWGWPGVSVWFCGVEQSLELSRGKGWGETGDSELGPEGFLASPSPPPQHFSCPRSVAHEGGQLRAAAPKQLNESSASEWLRKGKGGEHAPGEWEDTCGWEEGDWFGTVTLFCPGRAAGTFRGEGQRCDLHSPQSQSAGVSFSSEQRWQRGGRGWEVVVAENLPRISC